MPEGTPETPEARQSQRVEVVFKVSYEGIQDLYDYTENLSEEGLFVVTERKVAPGAQILFMVSFPGLLQPILLNGEVVWRRPPASLEEVRPPGIGVAIKFSSEYEKAWLRDLLGRVARKDAAKEAAAERFVILLAEDNSSSRSLFLLALAECGEPGRICPELIEADSTVETLKLLRRRRIDMLLVEWRLAEHGNLLRKMRSDPALSSIPILVIGASEEDSALALAAGADVFLKRPIPARGLIQVVQTIIREKRVLVYG